MAAGVLIQTTPPEHKVVLCVLGLRLLSLGSVSMARAPQDESGYWREAILIRSVCRFRLEAVP